MIMKCNVYHDRDGDKVSKMLREQNNYFCAGGSKRITSCSGIGPGRMTELPDKEEL
jgi:hypothetical protein